MALLYFMAAHQTNDKWNTGMPHFGGVLRKRLFFPRYTFDSTHGNNFTGTFNRRQSMSKYFYLWIDFYVAVPWVVEFVSWFRDGGEWVFN